MDSILSLLHSLKNIMIIDINETSIVYSKSEQIMFDYSTWIYTITIDNDKIELSGESENSSYEIGRCMFKEFSSYDEFRKYIKGNI